MTERALEARRLTALASLPRPADFLRAERQTPPRLLPLWIVALIALIGHVPGSTTWALTAVGTLVLGLAMAPIMGSIKPTVVAYVWLLAIVMVLTLVMLRLPLGAAYDAAWLDQGSTGLLAMILLGSAMIGAFTSIVWAALVAVDALRRFVASYRGAAASPAVSHPIPVSVEPASSVRGRRWAVAWRRGFIALICVGLAIPLPSFFELAGIHSATLRSPHSGFGDAVGGAIHASVWPALTTAWLVLGAVIGWLVWMRTTRSWRVIGVVLGVVIMLIVLLSGANFGIVPSSGWAQSFGPDVLGFCPPQAQGSCPPAWLFDAPRLAKLTAPAAGWCSLLLGTATAALALSWWRRRVRAGMASAPPP
jgi:hypothetical protein